MVMSSTLATQSGAAIPFLDLATQHAALEEEIIGAVRAALRSAAFVGGPEVKAFEEEFARFCGTADSVAVNSGTDALRFAYLAMRVQPGDEILTVPHTFMATTEAITQAGGVVKFVDVSEDTMTMDPSALEAAISPRTVGIVPVHLYGHPAAMDAILAIAAKHRLWVIEDACQAHGATYKNRPVGSMGVMAAFSFYPGKNLGACGEGGAITGDTPTHMGHVRQLREHGQSRKYYHDIEGYNGRLDAIQAAILRIKLRHLSAWNEGRRRVAALYSEALADVSELRLPTETSDARHVYHLFVVRTERRNDLQAHLSQHQIATGLHYPLPLHLQTAYATRGWRRGDFPVSEQAAEHGLSLPMFPELTESQVDRIANAIRSYFGY
jgi:dTDP-4-amino-4,6-dideoxygalactose transaminase